MQPIAPGSGLLPDGSISKGFKKLLKKEEPAFPSHLWLPLHLPGHGSRDNVTSSILVGQVPGRLDEYVPACMAKRPYPGRQEPTGGEGILIKVPRWASLQDTPDRKLLGAAPLILALAQVSKCELVTHTILGPQDKNHSPRP